MRPNTYRQSISVVIFLLCKYTLFAQPGYFSRSDIQEDLRYLRDQLQEHHPNLYLYSTAADIEGWFATTAGNLTDSLSKVEAFTMVSSLSGLLKDGHSYIYPSAAHLDSFFNGALLFPLDVFLQGDDLIVASNNSDEKQIPSGAKLIAINNTPVKAIRHNIVKYLPRDGDNPDYARHLYFQFFPAYYSYFYGFQKNFLIEFADLAGKVQTKLVQGLPRSTIRANRAGNEAGADSRAGISLKIDTANHLAIIKIRSFSNNILKTDYQQNFKQEIKKAFATIRREDIRHLAIDLRDNQGGELSNGIYLLRQFMQKPFQCVNAYYKMSTKGKAGSPELVRLNSSWDEYVTPFGNSFTGKAYLFTNGGSFSCSAIVANAFQESKRGLVLGEMTGGSAYVNSGGPDKVITLPHSRILFTIPKTKYCLRQDQTTIGAGVLPDIEVMDTPTRLWNGTDHCIEQVLKMMN